MERLRVEVAVALPVDGALVYELPQALAAIAAPGCRVRVPVGKRSMTGVLVSLAAPSPPAGTELRAVDAVLDAEPVLTPELLALGRFVAEYYLAPLGEVLRAMVPADLAPWGKQSVSLTDAGALAAPRDDVERGILATLSEHGRMKTSQLQARTGAADLAARLRALHAEGRVRVSEEGRGTRYQAAVELRQRDLESVRRMTGRSAVGREIVDYLAQVGRPATVAEVVAAVGCGPGAVRRLVGLGILGQFTQVERLDLARHRLAARPVPERLLLRPDQSAALAPLEAALDERIFAPFLLRGMTGAGKTEVYLRAAERALAVERTVLLLVPEISLVPALAREVGGRFGEAVAILHSGLGNAERAQEWERIRRGAARLVVGPRSALFAPLPDLGLIVVDEEQDGAYKQESVPRYHGRDLALVRARQSGAVAVLTSATPSLESRHNATIGKLRPLQLTERAGQGRLPEGILVDLRGRDVGRRVGERVFSAVLRSEIDAALGRGEQILLLRNRRGYAPVLLCRACGEDFRCADCGLPRTLHRRPPRLLCHYCGSTIAVPTSCPSCREDALEALGAGTERVDEEFRGLYPNVEVDLLDRDAVRRKGSVAAVLERFGRGDVQVLIGTQMLSKGHHFPRVGLTAVLSADSYLAFPDFRAVEKTYNLLTQIAGRAGRGERTGRVVIQTFHPDHYAIRAALNHDDEGFAGEEMRFRRVFHYPPFTRMVLLLARDRRRERAEATLREVAAQIAAASPPADIRVTGPAPAPFERLRGEWRFQLVLRSAHGRELRAAVGRVLRGRGGAGLVVDVDPQHLL